MPAFLRHGWKALVAAFCMLLACNISSVHAGSLTMVFYQYDGRDISAANSPLVTNSTKGFIALVNEAMTVGPNTTTSDVVGKQIGSISAFYGITEQYPGENTTSPDGSFYIYASFDHRIQTEEYNGTFLLQGSYSDVDNTRTLAVVGGTGDFLLARGYAVVTFVQGNATVSPATVRYECHLDVPFS